MQGQPHGDPALSTTHIRHRETQGCSPSFGQSAAPEILCKPWLGEVKAHCDSQHHPAGQEGGAQPLCEHKAEGLTPGPQSVLLLLRAQFSATLLPQGSSHLQLLTASPGIKGINFNLFGLPAQAQRAVMTRPLLTQWAGIPLQRFECQLMGEEAPWSPRSVHSKRRGTPGALGPLVTTL